MAVGNRKRSTFPVAFALVTLILLILLLGSYFANCFTKDVLGVSTFSSSPSKNPVTNGETFNFKATVVGDQSGALNATVLFSLTGAGVINSNIQGPGACLKLTDTTAACNNVNVDPNETINWVVPVTAATNCSQQSGSISLQTRLVATAVVSTSTAEVNCVASSVTTSTSTPSPTNNGNGATQTPNGSNASGNQTNTTTTRTNGSGGLTGNGNAFDLAGFA